MAVSTYVLLSLLISSISEAASGGGGVTNVIGGTGINVTTTSGVAFVTNTGVLSVGASGGLGLTGTAQQPVLVNQGVISLTAGNNITLSGPSSNPTIDANVGVLSVGGGTAISVTGTSANPVINNTGVTSTGTGTGITNTGTANIPVFVNTGVITATAGTNLTNTGTAQNPVFNAGVGSVTAGTDMRNTGTSSAVVYSLGATALNSAQLEVGQSNPLHYYAQPGNATLSTYCPMESFLLSNLQSATLSGAGSGSIFGSSPHSIPANAFIAGGDRIQIWGYGIFTKVGTGTANNTLNFIWNGSTVVTYTWAPSVGISFNFIYEIMAVRNSGFMTPTPVTTYVKITRSDGQVYIGNGTSANINWANTITFDFQYTGANASDTMFSPYGQARFANSA